MRRTLLLALLLTACSTNFTPASLVTGLQVLAVKSEPADIRPGDTTSLSLLVVDPAQQTPAMTTIFIGCDPDPTGLTQTACSQYQSLEDPSQVLAISDDGGIAAVPGARLLGFNDGATYTAPADLFDSLPADDLNRTAGVLADILSLTVAELVPIPPTSEELPGLLQRVRSKQTPSALALKEVRVAQLGPLDSNPELGIVYTPSAVLNDSTGLALLAGASVTLGAVTPVGASGTYVSIGPDGNMETRTSSPVYSWFASSGTMSSARSTYGSPTQTFTAPTGSSIPASRAFEMWVVVRDDRGGVDWAVFPGFVCDPTRPLPVVTGTAFDDPTQPEEFTLSGAHLDQIVGASAEGLPVVGNFDAAGTWVGTLPTGPSGSLQLDLQSASCATVSVAVIHP